MNTRYPFAKYLEAGDVVAQALSNHPEIVYVRTVVDVFSFDERIHVRYDDGEFSLHHEDDPVTVVFA